jgi:predicted ATPase
MPELDSITVKGFKSIASVEKSNFLGVFSFLHAIREDRLNEYVIKAGGADKVLHFGSKVTPVLHVEVSFRGEQKNRIFLIPTDADELVVNLEGETHDERLDSWRLYHFHDTSTSSPMKKTADVNDNRYLRPDGKNLAAFRGFKRSGMRFRPRKRSMTHRSVRPPSVWRSWFPITKSHFWARWPCWR